MLSGILNRSSILIALCGFFLAAILGLSAAFFGKDWLRFRREKTGAERLRRHADLIRRLRCGSDEEHLKALGDLRKISVADSREAILDAAAESADATEALRIAKTFDDLGVTDRNIRILQTEPSWENRALAAERLGRIGSARAVGTLLSRVQDTKDEDDDVRGAALRALGRIRDPAAIPQLIEALGTPEAALPPRIAEILVLFGDAVVQPLCTEVRNPDSEVRRMWAAEILGWIGNRDAAIPLIDALVDVNPEVRAKAAGALGKLSEERAIDQLLEMLLSDPIPFVRTRVAQALGAIGHPKVVSNLVQVLKDPEWWVRIRAIEALEHFGKESAGTLLAALEDEDAEVRRRAATALERMGYVRDSLEILEREGFRPDVLTILQLVGKAGVTEGIYGRLGSVKPPADKLLVRLVGDIGNPAAVPALLRLLGNCTDPSMRSRIVEAIGKFRVRPAPPELLGCLKDPDPWVRRAAVEAFSAVAPEEHSGELLALIRDIAPETRIAVCRVAAKLPSDVAGPDVERLLEDPDSQVRAEALRTIAKLDRLSAEPHVVSLLEDASAVVRIEAARALERIGGEMAVPFLMRYAAKTDEEARTAVVGALSRGFRGEFSELCAMAGESPTREQVAILLEMASWRKGDLCREFIDRYVVAPDPFLRKTAVYALRSYPSGELRDAVARAVEDPDETVRDAAVLVAASVEEGGLSREVAGCAEDPSDTVRFHATLCIGMSGASEFQEPLRRLSGDSSVQVRAAAVLGLCFSGDPWIRSELGGFAADEMLGSAARDTFLPDSKDPLIRLAVSEVLHRGILEARLFLGGSRFALEKEMGQRAREALTVEERLKALAICEAVASGQSYTTAIAILRNDPSPEVRIRGLDLLVKARNDAESGKVIGTLLTDPHPRVRLKAARLLGAMEFPGVVEMLLHSLDTADREFREEVTTALSIRLLQDPERGEAILGEIPVDKTRKLGLVWLLGKTRREGSVKVLLRYLEDENPDVRAAAIGALAKHRAALVSRHIRKSLSDPNPRVRAAAVNALSSVKTDGTGASMVGMLSDPDTFVRQRAAMALIRTGGRVVKARIRNVSDEPNELRPVWLAGGVFRGEVSPARIAGERDVPQYLRELFPESQAIAAVNESSDPAQRRKGFHVLQVLSPALARETAQHLARDPDTELRKEAGDWLDRQEA